MALADDIHQLRVDSLAALDSIHDYYTHTKRAWRLVQLIVQQGHKVQFQNRATGSAVTETELPGLAQEYVTGYLTSATFQDFVSLFEHFVFDFLRTWLVQYPKSLERSQLDFRIVLEAADKADIILAVVDKKLVKLAYDRVERWFKYLEDVAKLGCPNQSQIEQLAEIKASRDILVHNNGIANSVYVEKSMGRARFDEGEKLEISEQYHRESWQLMKLVISDIAEAANKKV